MRYERERGLQIITVMIRIILLLLHLHPSPLIVDTKSKIDEAYNGHTHELLLPFGYSASHIIHCSALSFISSFFFYKPAY